MTCRVRSTRENRRFSCLNKVPEDFFQAGKHSAGTRSRERRRAGESLRGFPGCYRGGSVGTPAIAVDGRPDATCSSIRSIRAANSVGGKPRAAASL